MDKSYILTVLILVTALALQIFFFPYKHQQEAKQTLTTILDAWKQRDVFSTQHYWQDPDNFPPLTQISDYTLLSSKFYHIQNPIYVDIYVQIDFEKSSYLKNNEEWLFKLTQSKAGWAVIAMKPTYSKDQPYTFPRENIKPKSYSGSFE